MGEGGFTGTSSYIARFRFLSNYATRGPFFYVEQAGVFASREHCKSWKHEYMHMP